MDNITSMRTMNSTSPFNPIESVMKNNKMPLAGVFFLLCFPLVVSPSHAQGVLIGPSTRNGSFEDGIVPPWNAAFTLMHNPAFASDGNWYASIQSDFIRPVLAGQNLVPNPNEGLVFLLSFDARVGTPGLDNIAPSISARTPEGTSLSASVVPIATSPLSTSDWQTHQYRLQLPAAWDSAGITFLLSFSKAQPLGGITHTAYLDNVVLQQIPEPTPLAFLLFGGLFLAARLLKSRYSRPNEMRT